MIYSENKSLQAVCMHIVGNKMLDEGVLLSETVMQIDEALRSTLTLYFISAFKTDERYLLYHQSGLEFNFVHSVVSSIFDDPRNLHQVSVMLAKQLYDCSEHNKIKGGEFYVAYFSQVEVDGETFDAVGLFKSENKDTYLRVKKHDGCHGIEQELGINVNKLDKGCLIFNRGKEDGYLLAVVDNTNKTEAKYWVEEFLQAKIRNDEYQHTRALLGAVKSFVTKELPVEREVSKGEQAELLDRTMSYFEVKDTFDLKEFGEQVLADQEVAAAFGQYLDDFMERKELELSDSFSISESAVKKSTRSMKGVIKLDKNFHIYVHGGDGMIRKGYDSENGMAYYMLYFEEES